MKDRFGASAARGNWSDEDAFASHRFHLDRARLGAHNYQPLDVILSRGEGVWVWDVEGNRYLDCLSAYSAVNQGHCHPKILAAMVEQAKKLTLTSRAFRNDQLAPVLRGDRGTDRFAQDPADELRRRGGGVRVKAVRKWGYEVKGVPDGKAEIIVCADNFHGRTMGIVGFSTDPERAAAFGPFAPGFVIVPFGDADAFEAGDHAEHRRLPGRADPGRGRRRHPAGRAILPRFASSAPRMTSC